MSRSGSQPAGRTRRARIRGDSEQSRQGQKDIITPAAQQSSNGKKEKASFISVAVRVRPRLSREGSGTDVVEVLPDGISLVLSDGNQRRQYTVDRVFDSRTNQGPQERLFNDFGQGLVTESINGYNVCIFAYGHTGSGKTYTMFGDGGKMARITGEQAGMLPRFLHEVFRRHSEDFAGKNWGYTCEFFEVYNETVRDLLATERADRQPKVHVHPKHGVRVENLTTSIVGSVDETLGLVNFGNQMRTVAATTMNERSSRSHAIFTFRFEQLEGSEASKGPEQSTVMFADLAGREDKLASQNKAMQFREMCFINTSLFHLAHLITKLSDGTVDKNSWTDFRNSKLTLLLSHALVGNSRTALLATMTPLQQFYEDTVSTMNFAASVKKIRTRPTVNNKSPKVMVSELEAEVRRLNKELSQSTTSNAEKEAELSTAQALIDHYKVSWEEAKAKSEITKNRRKTFIQAAGLLDLTDVRSNSLPLLASGGVYPFFTKLSDDPSLQGCCNYFLSKQSMRVGSDEDLCDIRIQGVGIIGEMCDVKCDELGNVEVHLLEGAEDDDGEQPTSSLPRVLVRGMPLLPDTSPIMDMKHGDCIIFGYAHAFRLVSVSKEDLDEAGRDEALDARDLARNTLARMDMASALSEIEEASALRNVAQYIANLSMSTPDHEVEEIQQAIRCICPLVDEANVITNEVCGAESVHFELRSLTGIFDNEPPDLVVCVLQRLQRLCEAIKAAPKGRVRSYTESALNQELEVKHQLWKAWNPVAQSMGLSEHMKVGGEMALLYVWPLEKFFLRLREIRDIYQEGSEAGDSFAGVRLRLSKKPHLNPWREVTVDEEKLPLQERAVKESVRRFTVGGISDAATPMSRRPIRTEDLQDLTPKIEDRASFALAMQGATSLKSLPDDIKRSGPLNPSIVDKMTPEPLFGTSSLEQRAHLDTHDVAQFSLHDQRSTGSGSQSLDSVPFREAARLTESKRQLDSYGNSLPKTKRDASNSCEEHEDPHSVRSERSAVVREANGSYVAVGLSHQTVPSFSEETMGTTTSTKFDRQDSTTSEIVQDPDPLMRAALWLEKTGGHLASAAASGPPWSASQRNSCASTAGIAPILPNLHLNDILGTANSVVTVNSTPSLSAVPSLIMQDVPDRRPRKRTTSSMTSMLERRRDSVSSAGGMGGGDESPRLAQSLHEMWGKIDGFCQELRQRDEQVTQLTDERDRISGLLQVLLNRFQPAQEPAAAPADSNQNEQLREIAEGLQSLIDRVDRLENARHNVRVCLSPGRSASMRPGPPRSNPTSPRSFISPPARSSPPPARGFAWPAGGPASPPRDPRAERTTSPLISRPLAHAPLVSVAASPSTSRQRTPASSATPSAPHGAFQVVCRSPRTAQARHHSPLSRNAQQSTSSRSMLPSPPAAIVARPRPISPTRSPMHSSSWGSGSSTAPIPRPTGSYTGPVAVRPASSAATPQPIVQAPMATVGLDTSGDGRANVYMTGVDLNHDGIPDVLQQASSNAPSIVEKAAFGAELVVPLLSTMNPPLRSQVSSNVGSAVDSSSSIAVAQERVHRRG